MNRFVKFRIRNQFNIGVAWVWVKASFALFREKPVNFMYFALMYVLLSLLPVIGPFFATAVAMRILMSCAYLNRGDNIEIQLNLPMLLRQRNVLSFALFVAGIDLIIVSILPQMVNMPSVDSATLGSGLVITPQLVYALLLINLVKALFYGISPAIVLFNHELRVFHALRLSWAFITRNIIVVFFSVVMLAGFLLIPLYLITLTALAVTNLAIFILCFLVMIVLCLLIIIIANIFIYSLYITGVERE